MKVAAKKKAVKKASAKKPAAKKVAAKKVATKKAGAKKVAAKKAVAKRAAVKKGRAGAKAVAKKGRAAKKASAKKPAAKKPKRKANPALLVPLTPSPTLAAVIGPQAAPRGQVMKKVWAYVKKFGLQDPVKRRVINADEKLMVLFDGRPSVDMFELAKIVSANLK